MLGQPRPPRRVPDAVLDPAALDLTMSDVPCVLFVSVFDATFDVPVLDAPYAEFDELPDALVPEQPSRKKRDESTRR